MLVQFISYNKCAKKPQPVQGSKSIYEIYVSETVFFEDDEKRVVLDTHTGIRVPIGFVAEVIPNPSIFWFAEHTAQGGSYFIGPNQPASIKIFVLAMCFDLDMDGGIPREGRVGIPAPGTPVALLKISRATEFEVEWDGAEPDHQLISLTNLN